MTLIFFIKDLKMIQIIRLMYSDLIHDLTLLTRTVREAEHVAR